MVDKWSIFISGETDRMTLIRLVVDKDFELAIIRLRQPVETYQEEKFG